MPTFITLTDNLTGSEISINMDLVATLQPRGKGSSMWTANDEGEFRVSETPDEIRRKIHTEQQLQIASASVVSSEWSKRPIMRRLEVVGFDIHGVPVVLNEHGYLALIDEITEDWSLVTSDGVSWVEY